MFDAADIITGEVTKVNFFTAWKRPLKDESEVLPQDSITERAYVPPEVQIKEMMAAGVALQAARKARFDTDVHEGEDIPLDPTREPGVDLVDVQRAASALSERLSVQEAAAAKKAAEEAKGARQKEIDEAVQRALEEERSKAVAP